MNRGARTGRARRAFTLMEMLIAIALTGGLLTAAVTVLFQVSNAWALQADDPVFDRHVEGLDRFIRAAFAESGPTGVGTPTAAQISDENALITLTLPPDLPWIALRSQAGGAIEARLAPDKNGPGLVLFWNTQRERTARGMQAHRMPLSSRVTSSRIYVFDTEASTWSEYTPGTSAVGSPGAGNAASFRVLRLELLHKGRSRTLNIPLPRTGA